MGKEEFIDFVFLDSCAFDPTTANEAKAVEEIFLLYKQNIISLEIPFTVVEEIEHPHTPLAKKARALGLIHSIGLKPDEAEKALYLSILATLTGNGKKENYRKDALHLFESSKYMQNFITHDARILKKKKELEAICKIKIFRPSEYLDFIKSKINQTPSPDCWIR